MHHSRKVKKKDQHQTLSVMSLLPLTVLIIASSFSYSNLKHVDASTLYTLSLDVVVFVAYCIALALLLMQPSKNSVLRENLPLLLLVAYLLLSVVWSTQKTAWLLNFLHFTGTAITTFMAARYIAVNKRIFTEYYWATLLTLVVILSLIAILISPDLRASRLKGLNGDPTTLASDCMVALWACGVLILKTRQSHIRVLIFSSMGLSLILLMGTKSVTPLFITVFLGLLVLILFWASAQKRTARRRISLTLTLVSLALFPVSLLIFQHLISMDFISALFGKNGFSGRAQIWDEAFELINIKPILGWGFDYLATTSSSTLLWHNHYHNGFLDVAVRGGFLGLGLLGIFYALPLIKVAFMRSTAFSASLPYTGFLLGMLLYNMTEVTFMAWSHKIWLITLFSIFYLNESYRLQRKGKRRRKRKRLTTQPLLNTRDA